MYHPDILTGKSKTLIPDYKVKILLFSNQHSDKIN